jgi:hypothetical protein
MTTKSSSRSVPSAIRASVTPSPPMAEPVTPSLVDGAIIPPQRLVIPTGPSAYRYDFCACGVVKLREAAQCRPCATVTRWADRSPEVLFRQKVRVEANGCHIWIGCRDEHGYGKLLSRGKKWSAHRFAYESARGPIPSGLTLDHLCRVPSCVNPDHLEPVSLRENILRGRAGEQVRRTHCPRGHPYSGENLIVYGRKRFCRECKRLSRCKGKS